KSALEEETLLVVAGDHGEALEDHGELDHGFFIYDATMKVPFLMSGPGLTRAGARVEAQVRAIDLMPTVLDFLEIPVPGSVQGVSLKSLVNGETESLSLRAYGESHYPRDHYGWSELRSLRTESFHFIAAPRPELYDLRVDPGETRNLAPERPEAAAELRRDLEELVERFSEGASEPKPPEELEDETREKLQALGYLGSARRSARTDELSSSLADPKDKVELHRRVKNAEAALGDGRLPEALSEVERVLANDGEVVEAHRIHGDVLKAMREPGRAAAAYREALALEPEDKVASFHLALLDLELGRVEAAEAGLRRVLQLDPRDNKSYFLLAKLLIARRELRAALATLDRAIENTTNAAPFHTARAECYLALGELDGAEASIRTALGLSPDAPRIHHYLGLIQEARGDVEGAMASYEKELARFPADPQTFLNLAELYRREGKPSEEIRVLEGALSAAPRLAVVHVRLGRARLEAGQIERARSSLQQGLRLGPDPESAALAQELLASLR
ncbi:MAG: tetratricopeptide repeat protein, partial [Vicinamibacteria bacterium]